MSKMEILYGIHPVVEALKANRREILEIYLSKAKKSERLEKIADLAEKAKVPVKRTEAQRIRAMAGNDGNQGVAAKVKAYPFWDLASLFEEKVRSVNPFLLLLDHIVDPQNLGAILRTALCVGLDGIIIPKDRSAGPTPAVSKASAGALEHIRLCQVTNMINTIKALKKRGVWILGLDASAKTSIYSADLTDAVGIVVGGEDQGIRPLVKKQCDSLIAIPQAGDFNSLNASAAGAVLLYEAYRQRNQVNVK